jgi:hypothetical protein
MPRQLAERAVSRGLADPEGSERARRLTGVFGNSVSLPCAPDDVRHDLDSKDSPARNAATAAA